PIAHSVRALPCQNESLLRLRPQGARRTNLWRGRTSPRTLAKRQRSVRLYSLSSVGQSGKGRIASDPALLNLPRPLMVGAFSVHGSDEQIFGVNGQILGQDPSD